MKDIVPTFLKWAGGKKKLVSQFSKYFPEKFQDYYEPFLGSGSIYFYLKSKELLKKSFLSDVNSELVNCFKIVKSSPNELISFLRLHKKDHDKQYFYQQRSTNIQNLTDAQRAARMIYLNRTCYNGVYRTNSNGEFNVPIGYYKNPDIINEENILHASKLLKGANLARGNFTRTLKMAKRGDFIYFDPPYFPISKTSNFTNYNGNVFNKEDQVRLFEVFKELDKRGCKLMISNSNSIFIKETYKDYDMFEINAQRMLNCISSKRGEVKELLITNY